MTVQFHHYDIKADYTRAWEFLIRHYQPGNQDGNWLAPIWEYMHFHPFLDTTSLGKIGVWEADGEIVALAHYESRLGEVFFQFHPEYRYLRRELLEYAEQELRGFSERKQLPFVAAYVDERDAEFVALLAGKGYHLDPEYNRPLAIFKIPQPFPTIMLPEGYRLTSLAEEPDWGKVNSVLHRGFNHEGEPDCSPEELESRQRMFDTPTASRDLKVAVVAPSGEFVAFCGMFNEPINRYAYVEPVATDPRYRRLGLGKAAVLEGIRRCGLLGATVAYVGSDQEFYKAIGFEVTWTEQCWVKYFK